MTGQKKNYRILFAKHGKIWFDEDLQETNPEGISHNAIYSSIEENLRNKLALVKKKKTTSYTLSKELEDLKMEVRELRKTVEEIRAIKSSQELEIAIDDAIERLKQVEAVEEIYNISNGGELTHNTHFFLQFKSGCNEKMIIFQYNLTNISWQVDI